MNTRLPELPQADLNAEQASQERKAFAQLDQFRNRLEPIAHKILSANRDLCSKTGPDIGAKTQTVKSFPKGLRAGAARELGLTDDPAVVFVRPGSAAETAGIKIGDVLSGADGEPLAVPSKALVRHLEDGLPISIKREGVSETVPLTPETLCDYQIKIKMSPAINAYANGRAIIVTAGMMQFVESDDELAYIVGHELAHNTQNHIRKSIANYLLSFGGTRYTRPFEAEADYVGIYYMERAGFDAAGVEDIWRRLAQQSLRSIARAKTHPTYPTRTLLVAATKAEIAMKRSENQPLKPEPRKTDHE